MSLQCYKTSFLFFYDITIALEIGTFPIIILFIQIRQLRYMASALCDQKPRVGHKGPALTIVVWGCLSNSLNEAHYE